MFKKAFFTQITIILLMTSFSSSAQMVCGMVETPEFIQRLQKNKIAAKNYVRDGEIKYLPINFINVGNDDGFGKVKITKIYKELCHLNKVYKNLNVQFYLHENTINELNNQTVYQEAVNNPSLLTNYKEPGTINIFIVNNATGSNSLGVTLGYFWPGYDYVVMLKTQIGIDGNTLPHELGHYFSLPHTFRGWDHEPWNEIDHGAIVGNFSPEGVQNELVDGSNCETAADLICDTPADYNLGFGYNGECNNYNGNCHDPAGVLLAPMEENFMGYFNTCNPEAFTTNQGEIIVQDVISRIADGNLVEGDDLGNLSINPEDYDYISPGIGDTSTYFNTISFEWDNIENTSSYFFQVDRIPTFGYNPIELYTSENTVDVADLTPNKKYYWRVWPINKYATCSLSTLDRTFRTSLISGTSSVLPSSSIKISPNPINKNESIFISFDKGLIHSISLTNILGKEISRSKLKANAQNFLIDLSVFDLNSGIYFINCVGNKGQLTKKIIIR